MAVKVVELAPDGTVTEAGAGSAEVLLLERVTGKLAVAAPVS